MLDCPHLVRVANEDDLERLVARVRQAFVGRPFVPATGAAERTVIVGRDARGAWVFESAGGVNYGTPLLTRALAASYAVEDELFVIRDEARVPEGATTELAFALDPAAQQVAFERFLASFGALLERIFPLRRKDHRLDVEACGHRITKIGAELDDWSRDAWLVVTLRFVRWSDGAIVSMSEQDTILSRLPLVGPDGGFLHRGQVRRYAADDLAEEWSGGIEVFAARLQRTLDALTEEELETITPQELIDRE